MRKAPRGRLALRIYLYSLFCVVLAVALFVVLAVWTRPERPRRPPRPPLGERSDTLRASSRPPPLPGQMRREGRRGHGPSIPTDLFLMTGGLLIAGVLVTSIVFARGLIRPLARLQATALAFGRGELDARARLNRLDEIGQVGRAFDEMADRTTHLMRSQRELMANISHELRTPLARMRVALDLAAEGDASTAREVLGEIETDLGELEVLVADVLTSLRLDMTSPRTLETIDPLDIVRRAEQRLRSHEPARPFEVLAPAQLRPLKADPVLLRRALDNVLDNARKYSPGDARIELRVVESADLVRIEVADQGQGIAASDIENVFTPFFRADRSRTRGTGGVGLGLWLARKVLQAHGGEVRIRSTEGVGTTVTLDLPSPTKTA